VIFVENILCDRVNPSDYTSLTRIHEMEELELGEGTDSGRWDTVVARRRGLFSSSEKRPFTNSNGDVDLSTLTTDVRRPNTFVVVYMISRLSEKSGVGGSLGGDTARMRSTVALVWWVLMKR
jgi:hypothetical protein